ncbi:hypothetical protein ANN_16062 [Periplaneta americana]|uniref:Uncharacterized protein n=1 Tax=Periplaneta americana TaxID=6978 RepID=A0ABQ8SHX9_PERAM|nr:hypothetical protein ANN_16062 [Periplaneta americana]
MVFDDMRPRIRLRLPDIRVTIGENSEKTQAVLTCYGTKIVLQWLKEGKLVINKISQLGPMDPSTNSRMRFISHRCLIDLRTRSQTPGVLRMSSDMIRIQLILFQQSPDSRMRNIDLQRYPSCADRRSHVHSLQNLLLYFWS